MLIQLFCRLRSYGTNNQLKQKVFNRYLLVYFVFMPMQCLIIQRLSYGSYDL